MLIAQKLSKLINNRAIKISFQLLCFCAILTLLFNKGFVNELRQFMDIVNLKYMSYSCTQFLYSLELLSEGSFVSYISFILLFSIFVIAFIYILLLLVKKFAKQKKHVHIKNEQKQELYFVSNNSYLLNSKILC